MNTFTRTLLFTAMAAVGLTQGCSCSDDDDPAPVVITPPEVEEPVVTTISGVVGKGLIADGNVNIHPIGNDGTLGTPLNTSAGNTNSSGQFSVNINDYTGGPIAVRVTTSSTTTMKCDLVSGCGNAAFGESFSFNDPDFNLDAVLPSQSQSDRAIQTNVTVLTDIASDVAFNVLRSNPSDVTTAINNAYTNVANRFGILGGVRSLPVVDLTDTASLANVSEDNLRYNLLNSSIVQSVINDGVHGTIGAAVRNFSQNYALNGLTDNAVTGSVTSLADIYGQMTQTLTSIQVRAQQAQVTLNTQNLANVITNLTNLAQSQEPSDEGTQGSATPSTNGDAKAKAQAFVETLGDLGNSIDFAVLKEDVTVGARADAFDMQVQAADMASSVALEQVLEATAKAAEAMAMAYDAYDSNTELTSWTSDEGVAVTIAPVTTTDAQTQESTTTVTLTVKQDVTVEVDGVESVVAIDMAALENVEYAESVNSDGADVDTASGDVSISGTAANAGVTLTVKSGSMVSVGELMTVYKEEAGVETSSVEVSDLKLDLLADIAQKTSEAITDPISFSGTLNVTLESLMADGSLTNSASVESGEASEKITKLSLALWGKVKNTSGDSAAVSFSVKGDGTGIDFSQNWLGDFTDVVDTDTESSSKFTAASLVVSFNAELAGIAEAVTATYNMRRSAEMASVMTLKLSYPGIQMQLATTAYENSDAPQKVVIANQDGVVATFVDGEEITGTIYVGTEKAADVKGVLVTYSDGSFGSLDILE